MASRKLKTSTSSCPGQGELWKATLTQCGIIFIIMNSINDELLSIDQLADLLGVSRSTVNRYRADGHAPKETRLPGGKTVRFRRSEVIAWLEEGAES